MLFKKMHLNCCRLIVTLALLSVGLLGLDTRAENPPVALNSVNLYFFWGNGCPHCAKEEKFLDVLEKDYPTLTIYRYEVWGNATNRTLLKKVGETLKANVSGVPFTVIGNNHIGGYYDDATTGEQIKQYVDFCLTNNCVDVVGTLTSKPNQEPSTPKEDPWKDAPASLPKEITVPIIGSVNLTALSLPMLAIVIGTLDGFNPCAMWVLLFLISLLVNLPDKKRRWLLGLSFLLASALVYFFFMSAWLNILLFIGFIVWIRLAIAFFAIIAGSYNINKFLTYKMGCVVENDENRKQTFKKLKKLTYDKSLLTALIGIIGLAFAVNLVELMCSAGFPAIFTQILALNNLSGLERYVYIALYVLFFMLDDLIVFFIAMRTLETTGISTKYAKYSNLIGGLLMILIGILLVLKPSYLMFSL